MYTQYQYTKNYKIFVQFVYVQNIATLIFFENISNPDSLKNIKVTIVFNFGIEYSRYPIRLTIHIRGYNLYT